MKLICDLSDSLSKFLSRFLREGWKTKRQRILIVEDDTALGKELTELLQNSGYEVLDILSSGESAITAVKVFVPHLILMDIRIQGMINGVETAKNIRLLSKIPIIFITAYKDQDIEEQAAAIVDTQLIMKPFEPRRLCAAIKRRLR